MTNNNQNKVLNDQVSSPSTCQSLDEVYSPISKMNIKLARHRLRRQAIFGDGNCLFRALSYQMKGHQGCHLDFRKNVCNYLEKFTHYFMPFVCEPNQYQTYLDEIRTPGNLGGQVELVAFACLYNCIIHVVHDCCTEPITIKPVNISEVSGNSSLPTSEPITTLWLIYYSELLHYESTLPIESSIMTQIKYNSDDSVEPLSPSDHTDSSSGVKADYKYSKKTLMINVNKVIQSSICQDKHRIKTILLENQNQLKRVLYILKAEKDAAFQEKHDSDAAKTSGYSSLAQIPASPTLFKDFNDKDINLFAKCVPDSASTPGYSPLAQIPASSTYINDYNDNDDTPWEKYVSDDASTSSYSPSAQMPASPTYINVFNDNNDSSPAKYLSDAVNTSSYSSSAQIPASPTYINVFNDNDDTPLAKYVSDAASTSSCSPLAQMPTSHITLTNEKKKAFSQNQTLELAALNEPSHDSDTISSILQLASPVKASTSCVSLKSSRRDEDNEASVLPKKLKSNKQDNTTGPKPTL